MTLLMHEARLLLRQRLAMIAVGLLAMLTVAALIAGMAEVARQRAASLPFPPRRPRMSAP